MKRAQKQKQETQEFTLETLASPDPDLSPSIPLDTNLSTRYSQNKSLTQQTLNDPFDDDGFTYTSNKFERWSVVAGSFFGLIPVFGFFNCTGIIQTYLVEHQLKGIKSTTVSWIFSLYICFTLICTVFSGTYFDRNGARNPILIGSLLYVGSMVAIGNCKIVWQFILAFGVGLGMASGILMSVLIGVIAHYFPKKERSTALAVASNGGGVGAFLFPLMLRKSYDSLGYAWSMRCCALISLVCLVISLIFVKERKLNENNDVFNIKDRFKIYFLKGLDLKAVITDRIYAFNILGCTFGESAVLVTGNFFSLIVLKNGFTQSESFLFVTVLNIVSIFGRYASGLVADKLFGPFNVLIFLLCFSALLNLVIWLPFQKNRIALWIYTVIYGVVSGGILSLIPSCCSQVVKANQFGQRYATMYAINGIFSLAFIPIGAAIVGNGLSNRRNCGFIGYISGMFIMSALGYLAARTKTVGFYLKKF